MTPTKLLIGQILVIFLIVMAGIWLATEWAAWKLLWQPELGSPWFLIGRWPVYRPWSIFPWWYHFDAYAPHIFSRAGAIASASGFVSCGAAIAGSLWRARQQRHVTTYGSARWASPREVKRAGLFEDAGVFLGRQHNHYLRHHGPDHLMAFAPTRSGKGVGPGIELRPQDQDFKGKIIGGPKRGPTEKDDRIECVNIKRLQTVFESLPLRQFMFYINCLYGYGSPAPDQSICRFVRESV